MNLNIYFLKKIRLFLMLKDAIYFYNILHLTLIKIFFYARLDLFSFYLFSQRAKKQKIHNFAIREQFILSEFVVNVQAR